MSAPSHDEHTTEDPVESVTKYIPWVLPLGGAVVIFLLAMITVVMA